MTEETDFMASENSKALRAVSIGLGVLVYLGVLAFTAAHNINLMLVGVAAEWQWAAYMGVFALEISAVAFPLGMHYWAFAPLHRGALIFFYMLDFLLLFGNTIVDYAMVAGGALPAWGAAYLVYFAPGAPLFALAAWAILLALDPRQQQAMRLEQIRAAVRLRLADQIAASMGSSEVKVAITAEAVNRARAITAATLGENLPASNGRLPALPQAPQKLPQAVEKLPASNGNGKTYSADIASIAANPTKASRRSK